MLMMWCRVLKEENSLKWHNEVLEWIERWTSAPKDIKFLFDNRAGEL